MPMDGDIPKVQTCLFLADQAEEAARFYVSLLPDSVVREVVRPDPNALPLLAAFTLAGASYIAINGNPEPRPSADVSIQVATRDQVETDRLWSALAADGGREGRCGWITDRFGIQWQIVPQVLARLMRTAAAPRVGAALYGMGKIDIAALEDAAR